MKYRNISNIHLIYERTAEGNKIALPGEEFETDDNMTRQVHYGLVVPMPELPKSEKAEAQLPTSKNKKS